MLHLGHGLYCVYVSSSIFFSCSNNVEEQNMNSAELFDDEDNTDGTAF